MKTKILTLIAVAGLMTGCVGVSTGTSSAKLGLWSNTNGFNLGLSLRSSGNGTNAAYKQFYGISAPINIQGALQSATTALAGEIVP